MKMVRKVTVDNGMKWKPAVEGVGELLTSRLSSNDCQEKLMDRWINDDRNKNLARTQTSVQ